MSPEPPDEGCPYKGLQPYTDKDRVYFFGRESEQDIIASNLEAAPLTVLHGASGVGKSSVLMAGVAPQFDAEPDMAVVVFRDWQDAGALGALKAETLRAVRGKAAPGAPLDPALPFSDFVLQCNRALGGPVLFVLDQFEEYFLYHAPPAPGAKAEHFDLELAHAVNRRHVRAHFLLSMREDSLSKLDRFRGRIPNLLGNTIRLEHLSRDAARDAVREPLKKYNELHPGGPPVSAEPGLVEVLLDQVQAGRVTLEQSAPGESRPPAPDARGRIETPYLQMVLERLWATERAAGSNVLRLETLRQLGGAERIVRSHLDDVMSQLGELVAGHRAGIEPARARAVAASVFRFLVTSSGKIAHSAEDLAGFAESDDPDKSPTTAEVAAVLDLLARPDVRVLRPVSRPMGLPGPPLYEIFHDVLGPALLDWRARYNEEQRSLEAKQKRLAAEEEACKERARAEREARSARRLRWLSAGLALVTLVALATTAYAYTMRQQAARSLRQAVDAQANAEQAQAKEETARQEAAANREAAAALDLAAKVERFKAEMAKALADLDKIAAAIERRQTEVARGQAATEKSEKEREQKIRAGTDDARIARRSGNLEGAIEKYSALLNLFPPRDLLGKANAYLELGDTYASMAGRLEGADGRAADDSRQSRPTDLLAVDAASKSRSSQEQSYQQEAMKVYQRTAEAYKNALGLYEQHGKLTNNYSYQAAVHASLAPVYVKLGHHQAAVRAFEQAADLHRRMGNTDEAGAILYDLGELMQTTDHGERALGYYVESLRYVKDTSEKISRLEELVGRSAELNEAVAEDALTQLPELYGRLAKEARTDMERFEAVKKEASALHSLGSFVLRKLDDKKKARESLERALHLYQQIPAKELLWDENAKNSIAGVRMLLGDLQAEAGQKNEASASYLAAYEMYGQRGTPSNYSLLRVGTRRERAAALVALARLHASSAEDRTQAVSYYNQALEVYREAVEYVSEEIPYERPEDYRAEQAEVLQALGRLYSPTDKPQAAKAYADALALIGQLKTGVQKERYTSEEERARKALAEVCGSMNAPEKERAAEFCRQAQ